MNPGPLWLVANATSGSNSPERIAQIEGALAHAGHPPARTVDCSSAELPSRAQLESAGVALLAIFTGDGTINAVAENLQGWEGMVLVLPGGTQNLLSKALHGDVEADDVVDRLRHGLLEPRHRPAVQTSQGHALVEVVAGPGALWADVREGLRANLAALAGALGDAVRETAAGAPVHVAQPVLGRVEGYRALRIDLDGEALVVDGYDADGWKDFAAHAESILVRRDFREGPHQRLGSVPCLTCRSDEPIALMLDGERRDGGREETFTAVSFPVLFLHSATGG